MIAAVEFVAAFSAALFAGAALYINLAEHPARMSLAPRSAALQWAASYPRATRMQAPLALVSFACGVAVWLAGGELGWLIAASLVGSVVPITFVAIMPTNHALLADGRDLDSAETRQLLIRWGRLHAIRTGLSLVASAIYVLLLLKGGSQ